MFADRSILRCDSMFILTSRNHSCTAENQKQQAIFHSVL